MTEGDNDIHRNPIVTAMKLTAKARQHGVRVSTNVTDSPIDRPQQYKKQNFGGITNI